MKIALIDHFDSFTYNVVELIRKVSGQTPTVISTDKIELKTLDLYDRLILSPGPGLPRDFVNLKPVIATYYKRKPILGICLGHQAIARFFGSRLLNLPNVVHGQPKEIILQNNSLLFKDLPDSFKVGLYHSWVVDTNDFSKELQITSLTSAGQQIMSLQHSKYPVFGIQFHPESFMTEYGATLMYNFLNL